MPVGIQIDTDHGGILVCAAPPFAGPIADPAKIGLILFHDAAQLVSAIPLGHRLLNFMVQQTRHGVRDTQLRNIG